jgi:hypothetical protein
MTTPAHAQNAGKIVDQYIKSEGGSKTLSKLNTLTLEGTFASAANEKPGTYTLITKQQNRYYSELVDGDESPSRPTTESPPGIKMLVSLGHW